MADDQDLDTETINDVYEEFHALLNELDDTGLGLMRRIAKSGTAQEFAAFVRDGELPAVELSSNEMQAVSGGRAKRPRAMRRTQRAIRRMKC